MIAAGWRVHAFRVPLCRHRSVVTDQKDAGLKVDSHGELPAENQENGTSQHRLIVHLAVAVRPYSEEEITGIK